MNRFPKLLLLMVGLTAFFQQNSKAQSGMTVNIKGIPAPLKWEQGALPKSYKMTDNGLVIESGPKTDMFRDPNVTYNTDNAPKLLFQPDADFVLIASIQHDFRNKWDGGALVVKADSAHWVKFCFEKDYTGAHRIVTVVTNDISDDCNSASVAGNKVFYKIAKADNVITLYSSLDGRKWFLVRHIQFNTTQPILLGFLAQSPTGDNCKVTFANISYAAKKIKDPYLGE